MCTLNNPSDILTILFILNEAGHVGVREADYDRHDEDDCLPRLH